MYVDNEVRLFILCCQHSKALSYARASQNAGRPGTFIAQTWRFGMLVGTIQSFGALVYHKAPAHEIFFLIIGYCRAARCRSRRQLRLLMVSQRCRGLLSSRQMNHDIYR
eukprot:3550775-Amphidinium_carterae.1